MAYKVSSEVVSLFKSCYRQIAKIQVLGIEGLEEIKESDILQGGLTIDRYCFSSNALEIGTAIASEATLELKNADGRFDGYTFDGAKLIIKVGIKKWNAKSWENAIMHYVPLGVFTIDEKTKNKSNITLNALDNMVKFDREYDTTLAFPATLGEIVEDACSRCGVLLKTTSFYNSDYVVNTRPTDDGLTYRQVIQWAAQLSCTNAFIDWDGQLRLTWFEDSGHIIPAADRYDSDMEEHSVLITGVKVTAADESEYTAGEKGSVLCIEGNSLAQSDAETIAKIIYAKVGNFTYLPYSSVCRPMPYLYPMDMITFVDRRGNEHKTIVSAVTYTMNGTTDVVGEGDGSTKGGYASTGSTTTHEKVIIEKAKKAAEKTSTGQFNVALALNETIGSAFGLYRTEITENKVSTWYYHDKATLNDSTIIYVFNSGGFAWTEDWNDGNPVWQYGFTKDGNALYKILSAYKIQAEFIDANAITSEKIAAGVITADKLSVEYKQSVTDEITETERKITQAFTAADGVFNSQISAEVTRATEAESSLSSRITQTAEDITAEVTRATDAEEELSSRINVNAESISAEVTRATEAESSLSSRITINANNISAKVSSSGGSDSSFAWELTESGFYLKSNGTQVMAATSTGLDITGKITAIEGTIAGFNFNSTDGLTKSTSTLPDSNQAWTRSDFTIKPGYLSSLFCQYTSWIPSYVNEVEINNGFLHIKTNNLLGSTLGTNSYFMKVTVNSTLYHLFINPDTLQVYAVKQ